MSVVWCMTIEGGNTTASDEPDCVRGERWRSVGFLTMVDFAYQAKLEIRRLNGFGIRFFSCSLRYWNAGEARVAFLSYSDDGVHTQM